MPCLDISKILLSICSLLSDPNPNDPLNQEASQIYLKDKNEYKEIAQKYTLKYANN